MTEIRSTKHEIRNNSEIINSKFQILLLVGVLFLAALLRLYRLDDMPALNADEAAIGYNAYSLLETGKDEHGNPWPIHFQSFNDYKPGLYFYIVLPFVKILGLGELAVRLPGAILGIATVLVVWLLVRQLFPDKKWLPELSALFLAISPWHIHFSRGGWEVSTATFFITLGVLGFVRGIRDNRWFLLTCVSFALSLYTYHAARIIVPLLVSGLVLIFRKSIFLVNGGLEVWFRERRIVLLSLVLGVVLLTPLTKDLLGPAGISRAAGVGLFADTGPFWRINKQRGEHVQPTSLLAVFFHNKLVNYGLAFLENYSEHFSGEFLFLSGDDIQRNKVPEIGQMYLVSLPFLVWGLLRIAKYPGGWGPIILWLLVAPIGAALTFQSPHALRSQNMVVPLVIMSAFGLLGILGWLERKIKSRYLFLVCHLSFVIFIFWDFTRYLHQYYVHMSKTYDFSSQYGLKELVGYATAGLGSQDKVVVTTRYDQPYIFFLFYSKYPPAKFQAEHKLSERDVYGFSTVLSFDRFVFRSIGVWDRAREEYPGAYIIGSDEEIPDGANVVKRIYFPSGRVAFEIVKN